MKYLNEIYDFGSISKQGKESSLGKMQSCSVCLMCSRDCVGGRTGWVLPALYQQAGPACAVVGAALGHRHKRFEGRQVGKAI